VYITRIVPETKTTPKTIKDANEIISKLLGNLEKEIGENAPSKIFPISEVLNKLFTSGAKTSDANLEKVSEIDMILNR